MRHLPPPLLLLALLATTPPFTAAGESPAWSASSIPGAQAGDVVHSVGAATGMVYTARFVDPQTLLLGLEGSVRRIDLDGRGPGWQAPMPARTRVVLPLPGDPQHVVTGADDGSVRIVALADGRITQTLPGPSIGWISGIAVDRKGRDIVAVGLDGRIARWRDRVSLGGWSDPARIAGDPGAGPVDAPSPPMPARVGPFGRLEAAVFSPEGLLVLAGLGGGPRVVGAFDMRTLSLQADHRRPRSGATQDPFQYAQALAFSPDGRHLAIGYWGGGLELVSWPDLQTRWASELDPSWISRIRWADDGQLWAVGAQRLYAVQAKDGASVQVRASGPDHAFDAFDLSPDRRRAALGPRMTGIVLTFPPEVTGDRVPARFTRPTTPIALPPALAPGADPCLGVRCPVGELCLRGDCTPID